MDESWLFKIHSESYKDDLRKHLLTVERKVMEMFVEGQFRYLILGVFGLLGLYFTLEREVPVFKTKETLGNKPCISKARPLHLSDGYDPKDTTPMRLIVAYFRSGSTMTADLIRHIDDDFYLFEPLHDLSSALLKFKNKTSIQFLNGTRRYFSTGDIEKIYPEMIFNWFACNFKDLDLNGLTNSFIPSFTPEHSDYIKCVRLFHGKFSRMKTTKKCVHLLRKRCLTAKTRTIKTIRFTMSMTEKLLAWLPGLKIVHLIRDPRGILNSRFEKNVEVMNLQVAAEELCDQISSDVTLYNDIESCYKDRMMRVTYEEMCQSPLIIVSKIYRFLGSRFTDHVKDYIDQTLKGPIKHCGYCTDRGNALANAYRWLTVIEEDSLNVIDQNCSFLYKQFGYFHLQYDILADFKIHGKTSRR